ncbi:MAG: helix-turn-helix domain-containing protein [Alphaproteobacteria bacterium]|nr:helix-turn-helix domain-containing protein [Alphaproteobacteria bacterium]
MSTAASASRQSVIESGPPAASADEEGDLVFKALAAPQRRALLDALKDAPQTTGMLCARLPGLDRCTVMLHLRVLEAADLVIVERRGRARWNHLNALPIKHIHDRWIGAYAAHAAAKLDDLRAALEGDAG